MLAIAISCPPLEKNYVREQFQALAGAITTRGTNSKEKRDIEEFLKSF